MEAVRTSARENRKRSRKTRHGYQERRGEVHRNMYQRGLTWVKKTGTLKGVRRKARITKVPPKQYQRSVIPIHHH